MRKRGVLNLPARKVKKEGEWLTSALFNGILVLDYFTNETHIGRYCINQNGEYECWKDGKWHQAKLGYMLDMYPYYGYWNYQSHVKFYTKKDHDIAEKYLDCKSYENPFDKISKLEDQTSSKKRQRAVDRKRDRINALMDQVPVLPERFQDWCNKTIFGDRDYLFKTEKTGRYYCTACERTHDIRVKLVHNQEYNCRRTKRNVTVKTRQKQIKESARCMVVQKMGEVQSVARHFEMTKFWSNQGKELHESEEVRYLISRGWLKGDITWYYGQYYHADEFAQDWWDSNPINRHCYVEYCYPEGVKEALRGTNYENLGIPEMAEKGWKAHYNKIMIQHSNGKFFEYLAKANLEKFTKEFSDGLSTCYAIRNGFVNPQGENAAEVLNIDMQRFHRLRQNNGGMVYLNWLQWECQKGKKLPEETISWLDENDITARELDFIMDRMSPVQAVNYLRRQQRSTRKSTSYLMEMWKDYLSMAKRLDMDINDEIVYRAKDLILRHDEVADLINQKDEDTAAVEMMKIYPNVNKVLSSIKEKYEYRNSDYILTVPSGIQDIMRDARVLHHCAGGSERYYERIENQETYLMFIRKTSRPLHPYYTLEVEPGGSVRQKRSEYNRQPELAEIKKFIQEWQKELKRRMKEEDRELAKESKRLRQEEMEQLRKDGPGLAAILDQDLMAVV